MLDHMLFNLQKWFAIDDNTDSVIINNNQYYKVPKRVKTPPLETMHDLCVNGEPYTEHIYDCVGVSSMYYVLKGTVRQSGAGTMVTTFLVEKAGCTPIWGVIPHQATSGNGLSHFFTQLGRWLRC